MKRQLLSLLLLFPVAASAQVLKPTPVSGVTVEISNSPVTAFAFDGHHLYAGYAGGISKIRVSDNAVTRQIALRSTPTSMFWDGASLWYTDGKALLRETGSSTIGYTVPAGNPTSVAVYGGFLYVGAGAPRNGILYKTSMRDL